MRSFQRAWQKPCLLSALVFSLFGPANGSPAVTDMPAPRIVPLSSVATPVAAQIRRPQPEATLTVTNLNDSGAGSLRQAIISAVAGDTINFGVTGTINLTSGELILNKNLTIQGPGANLLTIQRSTAAGTPEFRIFQVQGVSLNISGVTISNGRADWGAGFYSWGSIVMDACHVTGNTLNSASAGGGGIVMIGGNVTIRNSTFSGNLATNQGGAINNESGALTVINSTFTGNTAFYGGAILNISFGASPATLDLIASTVSGNDAFGGFAIRTRDVTGTSAGVVTRLRNSLVAKTSGTNFITLGTNASLVSQGHNLDTDGTSGLANGVNGDIIGTLASPINARVGSLQNLGGPVPTMSLKFGSPALDAGDDTITGAPWNLATDMRGQPRTADGTGDGVAHVDIGALESQPCVVTNTADSGAGSLRQCILDNQAWGGGLVRFNIPGAGLQTIIPLSAMPVITRPLTVDGYTQPGSSPNTLAVGNNAVFGIQISGASFPNASAFALNGSDSTVRGFIVNGFTGGQGASMGGTASTDNWVQGNFFGTNAAGTAAVANLRGTYVAFGAKRNIVGTDSDGVNDYGERNLLSGNINEGIFLQNVGTDSNIVAGNYIGTNAQGTAAIPNTFAGVNILTNATNNIIGGTTPAARNVISGNTTVAGTLLQTAGSTGNRIIGNYIGINAAGTGPLPNRWGFYSFFGPQIMIGGPSAAEGNVIAFNTERGVMLQGSTSNTIQRNSIHSNGGLGIELISGANGGAVAPVLTSAFGDSIAGTLTGISGETYRIEFFKNSVCDPTRFGEGEVFIGSVDVTLPSATGSFSAPYSFDPARPFVTATATRLSNGNTSAFSNCMPYESTTSLTVAPVSSCYGQPVTLTATVAPVAPGVAIPTGTVLFLKNGSPLISGVLSGGVATATLPAPELGTLNFSAQYQGSGQYLPSTSAVVPHVVKPPAEVSITAPTAICANAAGAASVPPNPAATYAWTISGGTFTSPTTGNSVTFTAGASGTVTLSVTATLNGCPASSSKAITVQQAPSTPVASLPANGASNYTLGFVAFSHPGGAEYDVYFDTVTPPEKLLVTGLTSNSEVPIPVWFANTTYYWKVVAKNACGTSAASPVYTFTTGTCPFTGAAPSLLAPANTASGQPRGLDLVWSPVPGTAHYDVLIGSSPGSLTRYDSVGTPETSLHLDLAPGKTYYWRVDAYPGCSTSTFVSSATWSFSTAGSSLVLNGVTPSYLNRWSGGEIILSGSGFLATDSLFVKLGDRDAGTIVAPPFVNSFSNPSQLAGTLTPYWSAPAGKYDTGVMDGSGEEGRLLQSLSLRAFTDVTESDWYFLSSARITESGILEADSDASTPNPQFSPNATVTRAKMARYLAAAYQWWRTRSTSLPSASCTPAGTGSTTFPDVPCSHPDWLSIYWVKQWGVTNGTPCAQGSCFLPENPVSRAEMVTFIERLKQTGILPTLLATVGGTDPGCSQPIGSCSGWTDASLKADAWPRREVNVAFADRLTNGCAGTPGNGLTFCPNDPVTRAQIGEFLARSLGLIPMP